MISSDFRAEARKKLQGKWEKAVLIFLVYTVFFAILSLVEKKFSESLQLVIYIVNAVISIPLAFGLVFSLFKLYCGDEVSAFSSFKLGFTNGSFKRSWAVSFYMFLKMIGPIILEIIAIVLISVGIAGSFYTSSYGAAYSSASYGVAVAAGGFSATAIIGFLLIIVSSIWMIPLSYLYQLSYIIAADNPDLSSKECVVRSAELMRGNRWRLFCLQFSFIGWAILSCFTFGIGFLWLTPYIQFATIEFYKNLAGKNTKVDTKNDDNGPIQGE